MKIFSYEHFEKTKLDSHKIFLFIIPDHSDRRVIVEQLMETKAQAFERISCASGSAEPLIASLGSYNLFMKQPASICLDIHYLNKKGQEDLVKFLQHNLLDNLLVMAMQPVSMNALVKWVDEKGLVLDLSKEKVWEKQRRLKAFVFKKCTSFKKSMGFDAVDLFLERVGLDSDLISQELDKVIAYIGSKDTIDKQDVLAICYSQDHHTFWQLAEKLVWDQDKTAPLPLEINDAASFHQLIGALRFQLELGLKIASLIEANQDPKPEQFPRLFPKTFAKRIIQAKTKKSLFFSSALNELYRLDLLSKGETSKYQALVDYFRGYLYV